MFFLQLASGSDCILHTKVSSDVPAGCIQLDEVQQANLRLCHGETYKFSVFEPSGPDGAGDGMLMADKPSTATEEEDAESAKEYDDDGEGTAAVPFELTDLDAEVQLLTVPGSNSISNGQHRPSVVEVDAREVTRAFCRQCCGRMLAVNEYVVLDLPNTPPLLLRITAINTLTAEEQQEVLGYHCYRGLDFKKLNRHVAVRDSGDTAFEVHVAVDTLTFDRVLLFLEAQALHKAPPGFSIHLLDDLEQVWLVLDGMVLDVGRWLPEHPGGSTIIPAQALDCDCSRFFEEFYIGELLPSDVPHVPLGGHHAASADFMVQLQEYTEGFRQQMRQQLASKTAAKHL
eukprot:gene7989-8187_t